MNYERLSMMKVYLLKDVEKIGIQGEIVKVADGFAANFIIPRKLGIQVTPANEASFKNKIRIVENRKEKVAEATSMLAEKIKDLKLTLKKKVHLEADGKSGKLYGGVNPSDVVELLAAQGISISKSQVIFGKTIKETGNYEVTIKLSSRLQPTLNLKVVSIE